MKRFSTFLLLLFGTVFCFAQNTLTVDAPKVVTTDENFRIVFTADGRMSDFNWPGSENFSVLWGPQAGSMSSTSIINGKRTSTHQETYTYIVQALSEGVFTLPAATATVGKEQCTTGEFKIEVVKGADRAVQSQQNTRSTQNAAPDQISDQTQTSTGTVSGEDIFLKLQLNKTNVVKGEPIVATLKLYTKVDITGFEDVHFPTFNGFWSKETQAVQNIEFERENVGGQIYNAALLRKYMLIPQQTGKITIDPAEMVCQIRVLGNSGPRSFFDSFFDSYQTVRKRLRTDAITLNVKALPAGAPASFAGGVGDFKMDVALSKPDLKAHEAASVVVTISGRGNISMLEAPRMVFPPDFEVYDLKTTEKISADGTSGSKTFEFPFIPRSHGDFTIEPVEYSFYDISKGRYNTITSAPVHISVAKGEEIEGSGVVMPGVARQGVRNLAQDIRFIHNGASGLRGSGEFFAGSLLFWILMAAVVVVFFAASALLKVSAARRRDVTRTRNRRANKMARARLRLAGEYLKKGLNSAYYEELHKAVLGYVSDKLSIPAADLSKDRIAEAFAERGLDQTMIDRIVGVLDKCEFARYAPDTELSEREDLFEEAVAVISETDSKVKKSVNNTKKAGAAMVAVLLLCLASGSAMAAEDPRWSGAADAFVAGEYDSALQQYLAIEADGLVSPDLYYNIANCYFKTGDNPRAILFYEKCLKLAPAHADALNNIAICREFTLDKIDEIPDFILSTWARKIKYSCSADVWAWITVVLFAVAALLMLGFRFLGSLSARKWSFALSIVALCFTIFTLIFSLSERSDALTVREAVMLQPVSSIKSSPGDAGKSIFVLHEGTKVELLDELGEWVKIEISDGRQGWVETSSVGKI